jgi:hypothetical protein
MVVKAYPVSRIPSVEAFTAYPKTGTAYAWFLSQEETHDGKSL